MEHASNPGALKKAVKWGNSVFRKLMNNGIHQGLDFDQAKRIRIINVFCIGASVFALCYCCLLAFYGQTRLALNDVVFIVNMLVPYYFNYRKKHRVGAIITFLTVPATLLYVNYEYGKIATEYLYFASIGMSFYYFKSRPTQWLITFYLLVLIFLTKYLETIIVPSGFAAKVQPYIWYSNVFMALAMMLGTITLFVHEHQKYQHVIEEKNKQLNVALMETNAKNEQVNLILKELNHRVKNNLQMVSSLFNIQSYKTKNKETRQALQNARNRIISIAIMHQKLYKDNLFYEVKLKKYVEELVDYLVQTVKGDEELKTLVMIDDINLRIEDTVHIGLLVNELVTNALKYGMDKGKVENELEVKINKTGENLVIYVKDSGNGFPEGFDIQKTESFGLDLVKNIAMQHQGNISLSNKNGSLVEVFLKIPEFRD